MKTIYLLRGQEALVDDEDYEALNEYKWHLHSLGYACRSTGNVHKGTYHLFLMHRDIMQTPTQMYTDHINHNKLDNRRSNLRLATPRQNNGNAHMRLTNTSGYKGVSWHRQSKKWVAGIKLNGKHIFLGSFTNKKDAARAYNTKALEIFGEFALINKI
jgi:hypothetical protein